jgi:hypothetical protein
MWINKNWRGHETFQVHDFLLHFDVSLRKAKNKTKFWMFHDYTFYNVKCLGALIQFTRSFYSVGDFYYLCLRMLHKDLER